MGVRVHKTGHERFLCGVDHSVGVVRLAANLGDPTFLDVDVAVVFSVLQKQAHPISLEITSVTIARFFPAVSITTS